MKRQILSDYWTIIVLATGSVFSVTAQAQTVPHHDTTATHGHAHAPTARTAAQDSAVAAFVKRARAATKKYHDLSAAIAAGYRLVGPDFPGMGEHWVHTRRVVQRAVDVARPSVLSYLRIDGEPVLTGVAYARPVQRGETPPPFVLPGLWHFHSGSIDEETLLLNPRSMHHGSADQPRLAMVHAWIWMENPNGLFAQDNWALPFRRLGLPVPDAVPPQAGKALFLLSDGVAYYARLIEVAGGPSDADRAAVRQVLAQYHARVQRRYRAMREADAVTDADLAWLVAQWHALWEALEDAVDPALWTKIKMLAG
jgi:hypothetical protein